MTMTFKDFLREMESVKTDVEDLSAEDLNKRAMALKKQAALKAAGRGEQAEKQSLRALQLQLRQATDPRQKADLQRRIKELNAPDTAQEV